MSHPVNLDVLDALDALRGAPPAGAYQAFLDAGVRPDSDRSGDRLRGAVLAMAYPERGATPVVRAQNAERAAILALSRYGSDGSAPLKAWTLIRADGEEDPTAWYAAVGRVTNPHLCPGLLQVCIILADCCRRDGISIAWLLDRAAAVVTADHQAGVER